MAIEDGTIAVVAGGNAIAAQTDVAIQDGDISLTSGGGSSGRIDEGLSAKGIKGAVSTADALLFEELSILAGYLQRRVTAL